MQSHLTRLAGVRRLDVLFPCLRARSLCLGAGGGSRHLVGRRRRLRCGAMVERLECRLALSVFDIADGDVAALIAAITTANGNGEADTINLASGGTYTLSAVDNTTPDGPLAFATANGLPSVGPDSGPADILTIHGNGATIQRDSGAPQFRVFHIAAGATLAMDQVTITGGNLIGSGAGLYNLGSLDLMNVTITDNHAVGDVGSLGGTFGPGGSVNGFGGGIFSAGGATLLVTDSTLAGNTATGGAGGDACGSGGGGAGMGGGIYADSGNVTITGTTLSGNEAIGGSGGLFSPTCGLGGGGGTGGTSSPPAGSGLYGGGGGGGGGIGGFGSGGGGGVGTGPGTSTFGGGQGGGPFAGGGGGGAGLGGALFSNTATVSLVNSTLHMNSATGGDGGTGNGGGGGGGSGYGGGIFNNAGSVQLAHITLTDNTTTGGPGGAGQTGPPNPGPDGAAGSGHGGGIYNNDGMNSGASLTFSNTLIHGNSADTGPDGEGTLTSQDYNLIGDTSGATVAGTTTNNITGQDPLLGPLADNGGPTLTRALQSGSPAIDAGDPTFVSPPSTDQRGLPRVANGRLDIGAYELQSSGNTAPTTTGIPDVQVNEDAAATVIDLRNYFNDAQDQAAGLAYSVQSITGTSDLFTSTNIDANGVLTLAYAANANGSAAITIRATDTGTLSVDTTFDVNVASVNDAPVRTAGSLRNLTVQEDSGTTSLGLANVAYGPGGGSSEATQTLTYQVTALPPSTLGSIVLADNTAVTLNGLYTLTQIRGMRFTAAPNGAGSGTFTFAVKDSGGITNGGQDTLLQSISITVNTVNDAPVRLSGTVANLSVARNSGATSLGLSGVTYGPGGGPDEATQTLSYTISTLPPNRLGTVTLSNGTAVKKNASYTLAQIQGLQFRTAPNATGTGTFAFSVVDNGGSGRGGNNTLLQSLTITVT